MSKETTERLRKQQEKKYTPNYTIDEIEGLIEYYSERSLFEDKIKWLVRYCDIDRTLRVMPPKHFESILVIGILHIPLRYAAKQLGITKNAMWKRYNASLSWMLYYLNTGKRL